MKTLLQRLVWMLLVVFVAGCAVTLEYGRWPDPGQLEGLRLGESDSAEILQRLGEPTGKGQARMPDMPDTTTVWSYEYQRVSGATESEVEINMLMVFLKDGIYQGHFWFETDDVAKVDTVKR